MKRISSEAEFYENGTVVIDADGVVVGLGYSTGWRAVTITPGTGYLLDGTGTFEVRRRGGLNPDNDVVDYRFTNVGVAGAVAGDYLTPTAFIPPGFRVWYSERATAKIGSPGGLMGVYELGIAQASRLRLAQASTVPGTGGNALQGTFTMPADGARPTL